VSKEDYDAGQVVYFEYRFNDIVTPNRPGFEYPTIEFIIEGAPKISCGYAVYTDMLENTHKQGWKHLLRHDRYSAPPLAGCYSDPPAEHYPVHGS
jgi:hypothetical protein